MKKLAFAAVAGAALLMAGPAMAQDSGFYIGAGVGQFGLDIEDFSDEDTAFKGLVGYDFNRYFAAELEYFDGGTVEDFGISLDVSGFNLSLKAAWPFTDQFSVYGKVGMVAWEVDAKGLVEGSDDGNDFSWGVGAGYAFTPNFAVRVEYQGFEIEDTDTADLISAAVVWKF